MKKVIIIIFCVLVYLLPTFAQRENSRWYMGVYTGMDFMTLTNRTGMVNGIANQPVPAVPTALKGPINTAEGCFSISDKDGNFMFASDGITIFNGPLITNVMKNGTGLTGHPSSTQSGVILPRPDHKDQFYVIASDYQGGTQGITYSIVDWSVTNANGRGEVMAGKKNIALNFGGVYSMTTSYEGVGAYPHANGKDFWIVNRTGLYFFVWLATKDGINPAPVAKYSVGYNPGGTTVSNAVGLGFTKFSMDGKYIANTCWNGTGVYHSDIFIAKFDNKTGVIDVATMATKRLNFTGAGWLFGIEFSPNNKYLYFTTLFHNNNSGDLWRIPITEPLSVNWELVQNKTVPLGNVGIGPDNKLYGVGGVSTTGNGFTGNGTHLYIIPNPDDVVLDKYVINNYFLSGTSQRYSLPNFIYSFFGAELKGNILPCINQTATYDVQISAGTGPNAVTKLVWDFGDDTPPITITDMNQLVYTQGHIFTKSGKYTVSVTPYKADGSIYTDKIQTMEVNVGRCSIPVNHNLTNMGY